MINLFTEIKIEVISHCASSFYLTIQPTNHPPNQQIIIITITISS